MRLVAVAVNTTGLNFRGGDRVVEVSAVELLEGRISGRSIHTFLNPERGIDRGAQAVHGLSAEFLENAPVFREFSEVFVNFVRDAGLIVHHASFHVQFLNSELERVGINPIDILCSRVIDTQHLAKAARPGKNNSPEALCRDLGIESPGDGLVGAALDARKFASIYLRLSDIPIS